MVARSTALRVALMGSAEEAAASYDADVLAYVATFAVDPGVTYKNALQTCVSGLKTDGVWTILDWLLDLEAPEQEPSLKNLKNPAQTLSTVGTVGTQIIYTANPAAGGTKGGWEGDGSVGYLTFGVTFDSMANFALDSATVGAWCNNQGAGSGAKPHVSDLHASFYRIVLNAASGGSQETFRGNDSNSGNSATSTDRKGHRTVTVDGSNSKNFYKAGAAVVTAVARTSAGVSSGNGALLCQQGTVFCADRLAAAYAGGALNATQVANLHSRLNAFLTARGSN
jgi:hypothetical protein